jgi:hypothetical protein
MRDGIAGNCLSNRDIDELLQTASTGNTVHGAEHVAGCERCGRRVQLARQVEQHFCEDILPRTLPTLLSAAGGTVAGPGAPWSWLEGRIGLSLATVAGLCLLALLVTKGMEETKIPAEQIGRAAQGLEERPPASYVGSKASFALQMFVQRGEGAERVQTGDLLRPGDHVRVVPIGDGANYLLLVHVDALGVSQVVYPWGGASSGAMPPSMEALEGSFVLDDQPGRERFVAFFTTTAIPRTEALSLMVDRIGELESGTIEVEGSDVMIVVASVTKGAP